MSFLVSEEKTELVTLMRGSRRCRGGGGAGKNVCIYNISAISSLLLLVIVYMYILCTISLAISYVSHLFCAHLCAMLININIAMTRIGS